MTSSGPLAEVKGRVTDSYRNVPIPHATIWVYRQETFLSFKTPNWKEPTVVQTNGAGMYHAGQFEPGLRVRVVCEVEGAEITQAEWELWPGLNARDFSVLIDMGDVGPSADLYQNHIRPAEEVLYELEHAVSDVAYAERRYSGGADPEPLKAKVAAAEKLIEELKANLRSEAFTTLAGFEPHRRELLVGQLAFQVESLTRVKGLALESVNRDKEWKATRRRIWEDSWERTNRRKEREDEVRRIMKEAR